MAMYGKARTKDFTPAPEGLHRSVCVDVINLGMVATAFGSKHKISLIFQTEEKMSNGTPYLASKRYTLSMHKKANLRRDIESWRGKAFASDEEAESFDIEKVIGANGQINISHNISDGMTYANIQAIVPPPKGLPLLRANGYVRKCLRPDWHEPEVAADEGETEFEVATSESDDEPCPF